jgi:hypothetical protein
VAQGAGLRWGLAAIVPLLALSVIFAGSLRRPPMAVAPSPR